MISQVYARRPPCFGFLSSGRTAVLIDSRARVAWWCLPTYAHFPIFAHALDPAHGGSCELGLQTSTGTFWVSDYGYVEQEYNGTTSVLISRWTIGRRTITICDWMPRDATVLVREIEAQAEDGAFLLVRMRPTHPTPSHVRYRIVPEGLALHETRVPAQGLLALQGGDGSPERGQLIDGWWQARHPLCSQRLVLGMGPAFHADRKVHESEASTWLGQVVEIQVPEEEISHAVHRSLAILRGLIYSPTGAVMAAPTASFPSDPGGTSNWDYRYCWVRDGCYTAAALDRAGCHAEAEGIYRYLLALQGEDGQWHAPLWPIDPTYPTDEEEVPGLFGPGGESPLRIGNGAVGQSQHDSPGNLLSALRVHVQTTGDLSLVRDAWPHIARAATWCSLHWAEPEAGIWECRDRYRFWTHGRAMCWVALDRAAWFAQCLGQPVPDEWVTAAATIREALAKSWSPRRGAFLRDAGEVSILDTSVLALILEGILSTSDVRLTQTMERLMTALAHRGGVRRDEEDVRFPFYLATLWMARSAVRLGQAERAADLVRAVVGGTSNLGLMAEYADLLSGRQWGNIPQAFSHEELVRAVLDMCALVGDREVILFPAIPLAWRQPGQEITIRRLPVAGRRLDVTLQASPSRIAITCTGHEGIIIHIGLQDERLITFNGKPARLQS
jgi:hypothetical protein